MELDQTTPHPGGQCPNILQLHLTDSRQCFQEMFPSTLVHPSQCVNILGGFFNNLSRRIHKGAISSQAVKLVGHIAAVLYWGKPQTYGQYQYLKAALLFFLRIMENLNTHFRSDRNT